MDLSSIQNDIRLLRRNIQRQRRELKQLSIARVPHEATELILSTMEKRVAELRAERDRQLGTLRGYRSEKTKT
jgi:hypothetical protein